MRRAGNQFTPVPDPKNGTSEARGSVGGAGSWPASVREGLDLAAGALAGLVVQGGPPGSSRPGGRWWGTPHVVRIVAQGETSYPGWLLYLVLHALSAI